MLFDLSYHLTVSAEHDKTKTTKEKFPLSLFVNLSSHLFPIKGVFLSQRKTPRTCTTRGGHDSAGKMKRIKRQSLAPQGHEQVL